MEPWSDMPLSAVTGLPQPPRRWQAEALPLTVDAVRARKRGVIVAATGSGKSYLIAELCRLASSKGGKRVTIVATPSQNLVRQLSKTIAKRCGDARTGQFYGKKKQANRDVIVVCYPSVPALHAELARLGKKAGLLIVDECHKSESETCKAAFPALEPTGWVGLTATPFRSVEKQTLSLWDTLVYRYTMLDARADGVLVPYRVVSYVGGEGETKESAELDAYCAELIEAYGHGPGIVSASSIADAETYADFLSARGISAEAIHSKLSEAEADARVERLKTGVLRCLVHVSMLAEGVDFPWLRWLCMRRPVGARVRVVQEVGRVLRVDEGSDKTYAMILDPRNILDEVGLPTVEALGEAVQALVDDEVRRAVGSGSPKAKTIPPAHAISAAQQWCRMLLLELQAAGIAQDAQEFSVGRWRREEPTGNQLSRLGRIRWATRHVPQPHRDTLKALVDRAPSLRRGAVSDLIEVLSSVADAAAPAREARTQWPWPSAIQVEALDEDVVLSLPIVEASQEAA